MTVTVFLASMTAVAFAAMLILALTSARGHDRSDARPVRMRQDQQRDRRPNQ